MLTLDSSKERIDQIAITRPGEQNQVVLEAAKKMLDHFPHLDKLQILPDADGGIIFMWQGKQKLAHVFLHGDLIVQCFSEHKISQTKDQYIPIYHGYWDGTINPSIVDEINTVCS